MKKLKFFLSFIFVFFWLIIGVNALSKYVVLMDSVNIRKGPATTYGKYATAKLGSKYYLNSENIIRDEQQNGSCDAGWYQINYNGSVAYVCSEYVKVYDSSVTDTGTPDNDCEKDLSNKGFPSSYYKSLCSLKNKYSNWNFEPIITGLDFNTVVAQESKCGKSYIETNDINYQDTSCTSIYSSSSIWKPASLGAVRYYLDPRNFLDEKNIFAFETLSYNSYLESGYISGVAQVLANASFYKYHSSVGNNLSEVMNDVGKEMNVSPVFIASRVLQELGNTDKLYNLYSGVYPNYTNYYNFYNIGVSDSCANTKGTTICGLETAKSRGWYGLNAAIKGGVETISNNYIKKNQNTRYFQKYNVNPSDPNKLYLNQYMTNIRAPYGEASTAYSSYNKVNALNSTFTFSIPVYENMPNMTMLPTNSSDNQSNGAVGETNVLPMVPSTTEANTIVTSSGYKLSNNVVNGVNPGTDVASFIASFESVCGSGCATIKNSQGSVITTGQVGTGYTITIKGADTKEYTIVIYGDGNGDGKISAVDLLLVQKHILKVQSQQGVYFNAIDVNKDGKISAADLLQVQKHILNMDSINQ